MTVMLWDHGPSPDEVGTWYSWLHESLATEVKIVGLWGLQEQSALFNIEAFAGKPNVVLILTGEQTDRFTAIRDKAVGWGMSVTDFTLFGPAPPEPGTEADLIAKNLLKVILEGSRS